MPVHIQREMDRRDGLLDEDEFEAGSWANSLYDYLWPTMFWLYCIINVAILASVAYTMATAPAGYTAWAHFQASAISIGTIAALAIICKWVIKGPDGLPWHR
jgi:hypothetical protein